MKILYFHQYFTTPRFAGGTRSYEIAKRLMAGGHAVKMVCSYNPKFGLCEVKKNEFRGDVDGIDTVAFAVPYSNSMGIAARLMAFLKFLFKSVRLLFTEDYDAVYATSTPLTVGLIGIAAKIFRRKKIFCFEVRDLWPELPVAMGLKNPVIIFGMWAIEGLSYRCADMCIGLSPGIVEGIRRRCPKSTPVYMIPNACDVESVSPAPRGIEGLEGVNKEDFAAVFTGAHGLANGLYALLDVAKVLKQKGAENIKIILIGDGKLKPSLVERAKAENLDNVLFFDPIPKKKLFEIVARADAGLMILDNIPAFYYGTSPNKFFDYLSCGIPVITNYEGWVADIIKENKCGYYVRHSRTGEFAEILMKMAEDPEGCAQMRAASRKTAETKFARDIVLKDIAAIFEQRK